MRESMPINIEVDGRAVASSTRFADTGTHVLVLCTTIAEAGCPVGLHSVYVGARETDTAITHLLLAPGSPGELSRATHPGGTLPVDADDRHACLIDHLQRLLDALQRLGHHAAIEVADSAVELIDR